MNYEPLCLDRILRPSKFHRSTWFVQRKSREKFIELKLKSICSLSMAYWVSKWKKRHRKDTWKKHFFFEKIGIKSLVFNKFWLLSLNNHVDRWNFNGREVVNISNISHFRASVIMKVDVKMIFFDAGTAKWKKPKRWMIGTFDIDIRRWVFV